MMDNGLTMRLKLLVTKDWKEYAHNLEVVRSYLTSLTDEQFRIEVQSVLQMRDLNRLLSIGLSRERQTIVNERYGELQVRP